MEKLRGQMTSMVERDLRASRVHKGHRGSRIHRRDQSYCGEQMKSLMGEGIWEQVESLGGIGGQVGFVGGD